MTHVSSPHRLHYPMQVSMGNQSQVNPDSYHTTQSLCDKHNRVSSLGYKTFRITLWVSYTHVPGFSPEGVNGPLLALSNTPYLYFFLCFELWVIYWTSSKVRAHYPFINNDDGRPHPCIHTQHSAMSLCICNANATTCSHVTCMMHTTWNIILNRTSCQVPCKHI